MTGRTLIQHGLYPKGGISNNLIHFRVEQKLLMIIVNKNSLFPKVKQQFSSLLVTTACWVRLVKGCFFYSKSSRKPVYNGPSVVMLHYFDIVLFGVTLFQRCTSCCCNISIIWKKLQ